MAFILTWYNRPMEETTSQNHRSVKDYLASLDDEQTVKDAQVLIEMMQQISGYEPELWNVGTIGFYPRKDKITVYLMDGTARYSELLTRLGKHTTSRVCVYIKRLSDVELP